MDVSWCLAVIEYSKLTLVLCWTDSWTMGEMASSRSVGMIGVRRFRVKL